jgi:hypothetical protein
MIFPLKIRRLHARKGRDSSREHEHGQTAPHAGAGALRGEAAAAARLPSSRSRRRAADVTFRRKSIAALLAFLLGAVGAHRIYLGRPRWWLSLAVTALTIPLLIGVRNWYQSPAFFVLMAPVVAGFIEALVLALMPDEKFDARFNASGARRNSSGWDAVLVAIATLMIGATVLMTVLALLLQTIFES